MKTRVRVLSPTAVVYLEPDVASQVVAELRAGDELTMVRTGTAWNAVTGIDGTTGFVPATIRTLPIPPVKLTKGNGVGAASPANGLRVESPEKEGIEAAPAGTVKRAMVGAAFPTTRWSIIVGAREGESEARRKAHDFLCERYWKPVYCYIRRWGCSEEDAKDLVQEFFVDCLSRDVFAKAEPERGRFRNFLLRSLQHFLANAHRAAQSRKRRPEGGFVALDELPPDNTSRIEAPYRETPEAVYYRAWSMALVERVLRRLEREFCSTEKQVHYEIFRERIVLPILDGMDPPPLRELAAREGLTEKQASNFLLTARRAYQRLMADEIRNEVASEDHVEGELHDLLHYIGDTRV